MQNTAADLCPFCDRVHASNVSNVGMDISAVLSLGCGMAILLFLPGQPRRV